MYLIGLDFGTTNFKALLYDADGRIVRQATVPTPTHHNAKGFAEYYPEELFDRVLSILAVLLDGFPHKDAIKALSFASMAETGVALDGHGKPLAPAIAWFDRRTLSIAKEIAEKLFEKNIVVNYRGGGLRVAPHFYNTEDEITRFCDVVASNNP